MSVPDMWVVPTLRFGRVRADPRVVSWGLVGWGRDSMRDAQWTARALPPAVEVPVHCVRATSPTCPEKATQTKLVRDFDRIQMHVPMIVKAGHV